MSSFPVDFPNDLCVNNVRITPKNVISRSVSKFTYVDKVYNFQGEAWEVEGSLPLLKREDAEKFISLTLKLKGKYGTFLFPLPSVVASPRGSWGGTPIVNGGSQSGSSLAISGLPVNVTNVIKQGDFINLGSGENLRLYKVLDDVDSDGSGETTVNIWPSLRSSPANGETVVYQNVKVLLRSEGDIPHSIDVTKRYFLQFKGTEALNGS